MTLDNHPNVFRYEGKLWASELPRDEMLAAFVAQRAWDAAHVKAERWTLSFVLGAIAGTIATLVLGTAIGLSPATYLVLLPLGFGGGVVLGAVVNRWLLGLSRNTAEAAHVLDGRPELHEMTKVPAAVARNTDEFTPIADLMEWSQQGFVPR